MPNPGSLAFAMPLGEDSMVREQQDQARAAMEAAAARGLAASEIGNGGELLVNGSLRVTGSITVPGTLASAGGLSAGTTVSAGTNVSAANDVIAAGFLIGTNGIRSIGVFNTDVTALPGTRTPVWVNGTAGVLGQTISTIVKKTNLSETLPFTAAQVMACIPYVYEYIGQVAIREDPDNEYFDPEYVVPTEIGLMAEHLILHGLGVFVFYEEDGATPKGIDYALFGAIANLVVLRDHEQRLRAGGF